VLRADLPELRCSVAALWGDVRALDRHVAALRGSLVERGGIPDTVRRQAKGHRM